MECAGRAPAATALWLAVNPYPLAHARIAPRKAKAVSRSACHRTPKASQPLIEPASFPSFSVCKDSWRHCSFLGGLDFRPRRRAPEVGDDRRSDVATNVFPSGEKATLTKNCPSPARRAVLVARPRSHSFTASFALAAARGHTPAIRRKGRTPHTTRMTPQRRQFPPGEHIPESDGAVPAR